jgi:GR25 family glycosyltransferase involved in LPS biosynthesis
MGFRHFLDNARRFARTVRSAPATGAPRAGVAQPCPIYVINLERSEHRRRFALNHLASLGLSGEIFPAVDGRRLEPAEIDRSYSDALAHERFSRSLSKAEIGCALSHLRLYDRIAQSGVPVTLVLEDDAMLGDDGPEALAALIAEWPADADVVQLIYESRDHVRVSPRLVRFTMERSMPVAAAAYLLTPAGARKLIDHAYPIHYPADSLIGRSPRWGTGVYGAAPQLVTINNVFPSGISADRSLKTRVAAALKSFAVRMLGGG